MAEGGEQNSEDTHGNVLLGVPDRNDASFRWTQKRIRFVHHYVRNGGNGTDAAEKAGYSAAQQEASRLLSRHVIQAAIQIELRQLLAKEGVTDEYIISKWKNWAEGRATDYFTTDQGGELAVKDLKDLTEEQKSRVKKISVSNNQHGQNVTVELIDPQKALDRLAEVQGLLSKDTNQTPPDEAARYVRDLLAKMDEADGLEPPEKLN